MKFTHTLREMRVGTPKPLYNLEGTAQGFTRRCCRRKKIPSMGGVVKRIQSSKNRKESGRKSHQA